MPVAADPPVDVTPSSAGSWETVDITNDVGTWSGDIEGAFIQITNTAGSDNAWGLRPNGATSWTVTADLYATGQMFHAVAVNQFDQFGAYVESTTDMSMYLVGWATRDEATFLGSPQQLTDPTAGSWTATDLDTEGVIQNSETAQFAFVLAHTDGAGRYVGMRPGGSSYDNYDFGSAGEFMGMHSAVGSGNVIDLYTNGTEPSFYCPGYMTANMDDTVPIPEHSISTTGSYVDTDLSGDLTNDEVLAFGHMYDDGGGTHQYAVRKNGSSRDIYLDANDHNYPIVALDSGQVMEQKIEDTDRDFYLMGGGAEPAPAVQEISVSTDTLSSSTPEPGVDTPAEFAVLDDFEDQSLSEYAGGTGDWSFVTSPVHEGTYALSSTSLSFASSSISATDADKTVYPGDSIEYRTQIASGTGTAENIFGFGLTAESATGDVDDWRGYVVNTDPDNTYFRLNKVESGGTTILATDNTTTVPLDEMLRVDITWGNSGNISATLYDASDTEVTSVSATDSTYSSSGGIGFAASTTSRRVTFDYAVRNPGASVTVEPSVSALTSSADTPSVAPGSVDVAPGVDALSSVTDSPTVDPIANDIAVGSLTVTSDTPEVGIESGTPQIDPPVADVTASTPEPTVSGAGSISRSVDSPSTVTTSTPDPAPSATGEAEVVLSSESAVTTALPEPDVGYSSDVSIDVTESALTLAVGEPEVAPTPSTISVSEDALSTSAGGPTLSEGGTAILQVTSADTVTSDLPDPTVQVSIQYIDSVATDTYNADPIEPAVAPSSGTTVSVSADAPASATPEPVVEPVGSGVIVVQEDAVYSTTPEASVSASGTVSITPGVSTPTVSTDAATVEASPVSVVVPGDFRPVSEPAPTVAAVSAVEVEPSVIGHVGSTPTPLLAASGTAPLTSTTSSVSSSTPSPTFAFGAAPVEPVTDTLTVEAPLPARVVATAFRDEGTLEGEFSYHLTLKGDMK